MKKYSRQIGAAIFLILIAAIIYMTCHRKRAAPEARIYGVNFNALFAAQKITDSAFLQAVYDLHPPALRIPGGVCNEFNWRLGRKYGDSSGRSMTVPEIAGVYYKTRAKLVFTINLWDTKESQLQWLDSLHSMGIPIDSCIVELGNELTNGNNPGRVRFKNGRVYGDTCKVWAKYFRKYYPDLHIACWAENKPDVPDWVSGLYSRYTPDFGVNHLYPSYANVSDGNGYLDTVKLKNWIIKAFKNAGWNYQRPLLVTEFNVSGSDWYKWRPGEQQKAIDYMYHTFITYQNIRGVWVHNIVGDLGCLSDSLTLKPTGVAFTSWMATDPTKTEKK